MTTYNNLLNKVNNANLNAITDTEVYRQYMSLYRSLILI